jgi:hypothetical protein
VVEQVCQSEAGRLGEEDRGVMGAKHMTQPASKGTQPCIQAAYEGS